MREVVEVSGLAPSWWMFLSYLTYLGWLQYWPLQLQATTPHTPSTHDTPRDTEVLTKHCRNRHLRRIFSDFRDFVQIIKLGKQRVDSQNNSPVFAVFAGAACCCGGVWWGRVREGACAWRKFTIKISCENMSDMPWWDQARIRHSSKENLLPLQLVCRVGENNYQSSYSYGIYFCSFDKKFTQQKFYYSPLQVLNLALHSVNKLEIRGKLTQSLVFRLTLFSPETLHINLTNKINIRRQLSLWHLFIQHIASTKL